MQLRKRLWRGKGRLHACCGDITKRHREHGHLTSQSLSKLQDGVEEGLGQAEDLKNAKGELEARKQLKAEKEACTSLSFWCAY